jgi:hypothetical protein
MLDSVVNARMAFFDSTPIGRVLNRFSADIGMYDVCAGAGSVASHVTLV